MSLVLVVDDEPDIRDLIRVNLEAAGHRVVTAADGDEAIHAVEVEIPDAILLDILMPGTDGWTLLERLKSSSGAIESVPVVMVTALSRAEDRLRGGIEGAVRYVTKPFEPAALLAVLEEILDPNGPPEAEQRRRTRADALQRLARLEARGDAGLGDRSDEPQVRLTRLEHAPVPLPPSERLRKARERLATLTEKQRALLELLASGRSVTAAAGELGTSRSNVYASLRRVGRRLGLRGTDELLDMLRAGALLPGAVDDS